MSGPLRINLVPRPLWNKSLAHLLPNWNEVRDKVCACGCCAICDTKAPSNKLHAHEVWKYNDDNHTVDLKDIIPVCENCHMALHFGKANVDGKKKEALAWYCKVNDISKEMAKHEIQGAFEWWRIRSDYPWRFNPGISAKVEQLTGKDCTHYHFDYFSYLAVPFYEKDEAKALGARWDTNRKMWCVTNDKLQAKPGAFARWQVPDGDISARLNGEKPSSVPEQSLKTMQEHEDTETLRNEILRGI